MQQSVSPIRDIVHDYIGLSDFEAEIIDSRYFQRLHFVWQNSAAFTVYPCNKNSRFVHSLGVCHLSGRIFIHSLRNSSEAVFKKFLKEADHFVQAFVRSGGVDDTEVLTSSWRNSVGNRSRFRHNDLTIQAIQKHCEEVEGHAQRRIHFDPEFLVNTLWLALKMAALCHDIGHLPMSHEFEKAIEDFPDAAALFGIQSADDVENFREQLRKLTQSDWRDCFASQSIFNPDTSIKSFAKKLGVTEGALEAHLKTLPPHERRSIRIIEEIRYGEIAKSIAAHEKYRTLLYELATVILLNGRLEGQDHGVGSFMDALKDILASQLDADRLDYVIRDPKSSGLETGAFDLNRIVSSFELSERNGKFLVAPGIGALTAIEAFFHQRYLNYKALYFHKSALRSKAVLRQALVRLIAFTVKRPDHELAALCEKAGLVLRSDAGDVVAVLPFNIQNLQQLDDTRLRALFFDVLNCLEEPDSRKHLKEGQVPLLESLKLLIETFLYREKQNLVSLEYDYGRFSRFDRYPKSEIEKAVKALTGELQTEYKGKVVPLISSRKPAVYEAEVAGERPLFIVKKTRELIPIEKASSYLRAQTMMVKEEPRLHLGFCATRLRLESEANLRAEVNNKANLSLETVTDTELNPSGDTK